MRVSDERLATVLDQAKSECSDMQQEALKVIPELVADLQDAGAENKRMRELLKETLVGAEHEMCKGADEEDPDPCWHCCDWRKVATDIRQLLAEDGGQNE